MEKYMYKCIPITGIKLKKKILINTMILSRAAALAFRVNHDKSHSVTDVRNHFLFTRCR
jgi:hypothetical protein